MKIQTLAKITAVTLPEKVKATNTLKQRCDVRVEFKYERVSTDSTVQTDYEGLSADIVSFAETASTNNTYHVLIDGTRFGYNTEKQEEFRTFVESKLFNKKCIFTTYIVKIVDLLKGTKYDGISAVHTATRAYTSFSSSFFLVYNDEQSVFDALQSKLIKRIEGTTYKVGRTDADAQTWAAQQEKVANNA